MADIPNPPIPGPTGTDADIAPLMKDWFPGSIGGMHKRDQPDTTRKDITPQTRVTTPAPFIPNVPDMPKKT